MFNKTVIIGAGLIGSSIGRALKEYQLSEEIIFIETNDEQIKAISAEGFKLGKNNNIEGADCVILATPVLTIPPILQAIKPHLSGKTILMDVASTKAFVMNEAQKILGELEPRFIGAHPIAGKETSGFAAGEATLFKEKAVILTPSPTSDLQALEKVRQFWQALGALVFEMTAASHDQLFAKYSHLSNILSFLLMKQSEYSPHLPKALLPPSFISMTRLAASNPIMWTDICLSNQKAILEALEQFEHDLSGFKQSLAQKDKLALSHFFNQCKK